MMRGKAVPALVLAIGLLAIGAITVVHQRSDAARDAQLTLAHIETELGALQMAPFRASAATGGSPELAARTMRDGKHRILQALDALGRDNPPGELSELRAPLLHDFATLDAIYEFGASGEGYGARADELATVSAKDKNAVTALLDVAGEEYERRGDVRPAAGSRRNRPGDLAARRCLRPALPSRREGTLARRVQRGASTHAHRAPPAPPSIAARRAATWPMEFASARMAEIIGDAPAYGPLVADRAALDEQVAASGEDGFTLEYEITLPDGSTRWVRDMGQAIRDADGTIRVGRRHDLRHHGCQAPGSPTSASPSGSRRSASSPPGSRTRSTRRSSSSATASASSPRRSTTSTASSPSYRAAVRRGGRRRRSTRRGEARDRGRRGDGRPRVPARARPGRARPRARGHRAASRTIVAAMRDFGAPGQGRAGARRPQRGAREHADRRAQRVSSTSPTSRPTSASCRWSMCNLGEINQVFLNLIVNAAHAIDATREPASAARSASARGSTATPS